MKVSTQLDLCCLLFLFIGQSATAGDSVIYLGHGMNRFCHAEKCFVYNNDLLEDGDCWESIIESAAVLTVDNDIVTLTVETGIGDQSDQFHVPPLELFWLNSENSVLVGLGTNVKARSHLIYLDLELMVLKAFLFSDFHYCDPGYEGGWSDIPFQVHQYVHWYDEHPDIHALKTADHVQISLKNRNGQRICLDFDIAS